MARDGQSLTLRASERCTSFLSKNFAKNLAKKLFSYSAVSPRLPYQANTNCILHFFVAKVHILYIWYHLVGYLLVYHLLVHHLLVHQEPSHFGA